MILELFVGSADTIYLNFVDEQDLEDNISSFQRARFIVKDGYSAADPILDKSTSIGGLTIDIPNHRIVVSLDGSEGLIPGTYIGECLIDTGAGVKHTHPFIVVIRPVLTETT